VLWLWPGLKNGLAQELRKGSGDVDQPADDEKATVGISEATAGDHSPLPPSDWLGFSIQDLYWSWKGVSLGSHRNQRL
jgi:hypothetical protein